MICVAVVLGELGVDEGGWDDCSDVVANFGLDEESSFELGFEPGTIGSILDDRGLDEEIKSLFSGGASIILFDVKLGLLTLAANSFL